MHKTLITLILLGALIMLSVLFSQSDPPPNNAKNLLIKTELINMLFRESINSNYSLISYTPETKKIERLTFQRRLYGLYYLYWCNVYTEHGELAPIKDVELSLKIYAHTLQNLNQEYYDDPLFLSGFSPNQFGNRVLLIWGEMVMSDAIISSTHEYKSSVTEFRKWYFAKQQ